MIRSAYEKYKELIVSARGSISRSEFQETGKLTPHEFINAGDALIQKFSSWSWESGSAMVIPSLPENKKYLRLFPVISKSRITSYEKQYTEQNIQGYDDWNIAENNTKNNDDKNDDNKVVITMKKSDSDIFSYDDDDVVHQTINKDHRFYDITIIYDQYYAVPRMYLIGYDYKNRPLSENEMMDDVFIETREKTVTIDLHPFLNVNCISIHPCKHADTMKRMMDDMEKRIMEGQDDVQFYFPPGLSLFVFLRFMASVIPTIEYDVDIGLDF
jgi:ubiquitin-like-conjugating enzyme ATG3